jgi:hypothetical protein
MATVRRNSRIPRSVLPTSAREINTPDESLRNADPTGMGRLEKGINMNAHSIVGTARIVLLGLLLAVMMLGAAALAGSRAPSVAGNTTHYAFPDCSPVGNCGLG